MRGFAKGVLRAFGPRMLQSSAVQGGITQDQTRMGLGRETSAPDIDNYCEQARRIMDLPDVLIGMTKFRRFFLCLRQLV